MPDSRDAGNQWSRWLNTELHRTRMPKSQLASRLGVNRTTIYNWLNGETRGITVAMAERVAVALGASRDEALAAAGQTEPPTTTPGRPAPVSTEATIPEAFGPWLTRSRQRAGFATPAALAEATRFDPDEVYAWEHGTSRPEIWECLAIARAVAVRDVDILAAAGWIQLDPDVLAAQRIIEERGSDDPDVAALRRFVRLVRDQD